jgi:hypothetical protein
MADNKQGQTRAQESESEIPDYGSYGQSRGDRQRGAEGPL